MRTNRILCTLVVGAVLLLAAGPAVALEGEEYKQRLAELEPRLDELQTAGTVGETWRGEVAVVEGASADSTVHDLVAEVNRNRQAIYRIIAEKISRETGKTVTADMVGRKKGEDNFADARPGEWLLFRDGQWKRKT
jgi:uncharacterized protein YdbL (DUF1318 family)